MPIITPGRAFGVNKMTKKKRVVHKATGSLTMCGIYWIYVNRNKEAFILFDATDDFEYVTCSSCLRLKLKRKKK